jgi:hypothetical protein
MNVPKMKSFGEEKKHMPLKIGLPRWYATVTSAMVASHTLKRWSVNTLLNLVTIKHYNLIGKDMQENLGL